VLAKLASPNKAVASSETSPQVGRRLAPGSHWRFVKTIRSSGELAGKLIVPDLIREARISGPPRVLPYRQQPKPQQELPQQDWALTKALAAKKVRTRARPKKALLMALSLRKKLDLEKETAGRVRFFLNPENAVFDEEGNLDYSK
jgi:hypothetical protein